MSANTAIQILTLPKTAGGRKAALMPGGKGNILRQKAMGALSQTLKHC